MSAIPPDVHTSVHTSFFSKDLSNFKQSDLKSIYLRETTDKHNNKTYRIATTESPLIKSIYHFFVEKLSLTKHTYLEGEAALEKIKSNPALYKPLLLKYREDLEKQISPDNKASKIGPQALGTEFINKTSTENKKEKKGDDKFNFIVELLKDKYVIPKLSDPPYSLLATKDSDLEIIKQLAIARANSGRSKLSDLRNYGFDLKNEDHREFVKHLILKTDQSKIYNLLKDCKFIFEDKKLLEDISLELAKNPDNSIHMFSFGTTPFDQFDIELINKFGMERAKNGFDIIEEIPLLTKLGIDDKSIQNMVVEQVFQGKAPIDIASPLIRNIPYSEDFTLKVLTKALDSPTITPTDINIILKIPLCMKGDIKPSNTTIKDLLKSPGVEELLQAKYKFIEKSAHPVYPYDNRNNPVSSWMDYSNWKSIDSNTTETTSTRFTSNGNDIDKIRPPLTTIYL